MIFVVDDDVIMAKCVARATKKETRIFTNAIEAMNEISSDEMPKLIFLDVLLDGPDGFTFLNELVSYPDTRMIPIVIVSSLDYSNEDLSSYGVVGYLNKEKMTPQEIYQYAKKYAK